MQIIPFQTLNQNVKNILNYHRRRTNYSGVHLNEYLLKSQDTFLEHLFYESNPNIYRKCTYRHIQIHIENLLVAHTHTQIQENGKKRKKNLI